MKRRNLLVAGMAAVAAPTIISTSAQAQVQQPDMRPIVSLTFNASAFSAYKRALPVMKDRGLVGTMYILPKDMTDLTDPSVPEEPWTRISWEMAKDLVKEGWELGASGMSFSDLTQLPLDKLKVEIKDAAALIKEKTGVMPTSFASPAGSFNETTLNAIAQVYKSHVGLTWRGVKSPGINAQNMGLPFRLSRAVITEGDVNDFCNGIEAIIATKAHVILSLGNVVPQVLGGDDSSISLAGFHKLAGYIARAAVKEQLQVRTVTEGLALSYTNTARGIKASLRQQ